MLMQSFVGGTGKDTTEIVKMCLDKLKPEGRIVIGMIQIETILFSFCLLYRSKVSSQLT